jgi:hypothetical protein
MNWFIGFFVSIAVGIGSLFGIHQQATTTTMINTGGGTGVVSEPGKPAPPSSPAFPSPVLPVSIYPHPVKNPPQPTAPPMPIPSPLASLTIASIAPASGQVGSAVTLHGSGFLSTNTVLFGGGPINNVSSTNGGTVLTFTVPSSIGPDCQPGMMCPMYERLVTDDTYSIAVRNADGTSDAVSFIVTGSSSL